MREKSRETKDTLFGGNEVAVVVEGPRIRGSSGGGDAVEVSSALVKDFEVAGVAEPGLECGIGQSSKPATTIEAQCHRCQLFYSTLHNGTVTAHDAFISHYLSDVLSESLMCFGASSTTIDEQDSHESGDEIWISSTFDIDQDVKDCISRAADSVELKEIPNYEVEMHDHTDWIKKTQESFHPVEITEGLWIVPEWRNPPDLQAINIILNPGLAFGTGEHPTTKLCLLLRISKRRRILSGLWHRFRCSCNCSTKDLAERIVSYAKPGAVVGVSGIISEQVPKVVEHYSQFLEDINVSTMDDWACITGSKKTEPGTT
ncbi:UNVERIFIED_CONTAM: Ribosomal protein L11 methyltransferase [Sesamum radiatum]|uniref:ETFB lysine methyltransferase n=1 Tax=Sesamum radiatum TaxID=300843 RepID=A0AAW2KK00_SESRA